LRFTLSAKSREVGVAGISQWVRLPSNWINDGGLSSLPWKNGGRGADHIAALMALTVVAHAADPETGVARVTYDHFSAVTGLSRAKVSKGLDALARIKVIEREAGGARSTFKLASYDPLAGWAKFPAKSMYSLGRITAFADFQLRRAAELDALKLFFLFVARRNRITNIANIGYEKIEEYTNIRRVRIKTAISFLASVSLVYVEHIPSKETPLGISNAYRIVGVEPYAHMGTRGRSLESRDFEAS
jgi:hypothetical protein